jgi:hypothetical protein
MGLDNIPHRYACERLGTAVKVDVLDMHGVAILDEETSLPMKRIDCKETQTQGKCPYLISVSKTGLQEAGVTGIFGTDCWYRGKFGNFLIEALELPDFEYSFYGDNEDGTYKSSSDCLSLADSMEERMTEMGTVLKDGENLDKEVKYAI